MLMVSCLVAFLRACACNVLLFSIWVFSDDETVTLPRKSSLLKNLPNEYYTTPLPSHPEKEDTIEKNNNIVEACGMSGAADKEEDSPDKVCMAAEESAPPECGVM